MRELNIKVICIEPYVYCMGVWRQGRSSITCKASKATPKDQAHKCLLSTFLRTRAKGACQDLPHWHQRPDCWRTCESSGTKWLPASLPQYVQCITSLSHQSEGVLCNWKYFGTYLGYLPTIPMSPQCDTFQLIPVSFYDFLGHFTSSSTLKLEWFSLVSSLNLHSFFLETPRISLARVGLSKSLLVIE